MFTYGPGRIPPPADLGIPQGLIAGSFPPGDLATDTGRMQTRLYLGNISASMTQEGILEFFNALMHERGFAKEEGDPITECAVNKEKAFASLDVGCRAHHLSKPS